MKILAIIPARSGSKGIHLKNIKKLVEVPLIEYTLNSAKKSNKINKILVSTDDKQIIKICNKLSIEAPFIRPKTLARDDTSITEVIHHSLQYLQDVENYVPDIIILLQPTSPLRTHHDIDKGIQLLLKSNATSVISVSTLKKHPYISFWKKVNYLKPFQKNFLKYNGRQKLPTLFYPNGTIYVFWYNTWIKYGTIYGPRIKPMIMLPEKSIDIDVPLDFFFCEMIIKNWKSFKKRF